MKTWEALPISSKIFKCVLWGLLYNDIEKI
jgi:hypothetical protein